MHRNGLLSLLEKYQPLDERDAHHRRQVVEFIRNNPECFERTLKTGHITGSCWLVNASEECVALTFHRKLTKWLQPGGHADGESDVINVALREAQEETGLTNLQIVSNEIFDIDVHPIPARAEEPEHFHYDIRFAFRVPDTHEHQLIISEESIALAWCPLSQFELMGAEESLLRMKRKWLQRFVKDRFQRSYHKEVVERLHRLASSSPLQPEKYGTVQNSSVEYPLYRLVPQSKRPELPHVLLVAGIHGDEPAGILAALAFAEQKIEQYKNKINFTIYPCINPSGFDLDTRRNARGVDLNRNCHSLSEDPEIKSALQSLESDQQKYILSIDLHEDNPFIKDDCCQGHMFPSAFYFYETCFLGSLRIGDKIIRELDNRKISTCTLAEIYGDKNYRGVVRYGEGSNNKTYLGLNKLDEWLIQSKTNLCFQMETPLGWSLSHRIEAHLVAIDATLKAWQESQQEIFVGGGV